ncbi:hypothetical protein SDC9_123560 [bioreactor metagenome]|uniref:Uncharacterized protein n=1 Tax=bioreactor metagenome TaxID=1076179 RepID=A0A645CI02_9ZZZZ
MWRSAKASAVMISIMPLGMNFLVFARRIANTTRSAAMIRSASPRERLGWSSPGIAVITRSAAATAEVISETRLLALKKPNKPPANIRMMYIQRTVLGFIKCVNVARVG